MGYVNVTDISQFISPFDIRKIGGTWTPTIATNVISDVRTTALADTTWLIPAVLPGSQIALQGAKLESFTIWYEIGVAVGTGFTVALNRVNLNAHGVAVDGIAIAAISFDDDHAAAADRFAIDDHEMTVSLDTPVFIDAAHAYWLSCVIGCDTATTLELFGARANFTLRL